MNSTKGHVRDGLGLGATARPHASYEQMATVVTEYAAAKSRQDIDAALNLCTGDFSIHTDAIYATAKGKGNVRRQLGHLFAVFPDYHVELDGSAVNDYGYACWGTAHMTMRRRIGPWPATHRSTALPFYCIFTFRGDKILREEFFFSRDVMADQLGLSANVFRQLAKLVARLPMRMQVAL